jgi:acyl-CoA reductase-like NAD-dependent aldehyde dehydrogenase
MTRQITTINPATEEVINTYEMVTKEQIKEKTKKAQKTKIELPYFMAQKKVDLTMP